MSQKLWIWQKRYKRISTNIVWHLLVGITILVALSSRAILNKSLLSIHHCSTFQFLVLVSHPEIYSDLTSINNFVHCLFYFYLSACCICVPWRTKTLIMLCNIVLHKDVGYKSPSIFFFWQHHETSLRLLLVEGIVSNTHPSCWFSWQRMCQHDRVFSPDRLKSRWSLFFHIWRVYI